MSMTWMSLKPESAKFLRISQPRPPAPLRMTCQRAVVAEVSVPLHYPISVCQHRTRTCNWRIRTRSLSRPWLLLPIWHLVQLGSLDP